MKELSGIKNIIFDLGGVLLNIDPKRTIEAFTRLGMDELIGHKGLTYDHEIFYLMEQGRVSPDEFRNGVRELLPEKATDEQIDAAWSAMLLDFPASRVQIVLNLKKQYNTYLFSNTNAIHVKKFQDDFRKAHGIELSSLFVKDFYSNEINLRKPNPEAFDKVIELAGIRSEETLFIDDSEVNIQAADKLGLKTLWLQPGMKLEEIFLEYA